MMMTVVTRLFRHSCAVALIVGTSGLVASAAFADTDSPDSYPPGWNVKSPPAGPQAYEWDYGLFTGLRATGAVPAPTPPQNAQVIYQMVPGGHRYHRIAQ
jgi:hypothetical protein